MKDMHINTTLSYVMKTIFSLLLLRGAGVTAIPESYSRGRIERLTIKSEGVIN